MLNFCDFIQVYVFTTNHHLKAWNTGMPLFFIDKMWKAFAICIFSTKKGIIIIDSTDQLSTTTVREKVTELTIIHNTRNVTINFCSISRQLKKRLKSPQKRSTRILQDTGPRDPLKVGILGCGRLGSQLAHCLITYGSINPKDLKISTRRPETLG